jgi:hypothetical protein
LLGERVRQALLTANRVAAGRYTFFASQARQMPPQRQYDATLTLKPSLAGKPQRLRSLIMFT